MNLDDIATRILDARRTTRSGPLGRRAARRLANDTETLLAAVTAILTLHRPDQYGTCEICRDGPGGPDIGAPCPTAAVALGIDPPVLPDDEQSRADRRRASLNPDERLCYSDECGEPCRSAQEMARRELQEVRRQLATVEHRLGEARQRAERDSQVPADPAEALRLAGQPTGSTGAIRRTNDLVEEVAAVLCAALGTWPDDDFTGEALAVLTVVQEHLSTPDTPEGV